VAVQMTGRAQTRDHSSNARQCHRFAAAQYGRLHSAANWDIESDELHEFDESYE